MKWQHTKRSKEDYDQAPSSVQRAFDKQVRLLAHDLLYPSLHAKKYDEPANLWQARVNKGWRFYFQIDQDTYIVTRIIPHPK
jgi:mRNA interferase RelE/StbE